MDVLVRLLTLRPVFTLFGLRAAWYVYLLNVAVQLYLTTGKLLQAIQQQGASWEDWSPNLFPLALSILAQLLLVRLLMEVAATILLTGNSTAK